MIFDTTFRDKRIETAITDLAGERFNLIQRWRIKGTGSQKFFVRSSSPEIDEKVCRKYQLKHCNIELRKQGVVLHFGSFARTFVWAIPYRQLDLEKNCSQITIYSGAHFMTIADAYGGAIDNQFLSKLHYLKAEQVLQSFEEHRLSV